MLKEPVSQMGGGLLALCGSSQGRSGGFPGTADYRYESGVGVLGKLPKQLLFPICVHLVHPPSHACPHPARACIVLPRAAPQSMRPREPREPDTAEDAGGQTDHLGQAYKGGLRKGRPFHKPPSFMNSLNPFIFSTLKSLFGRRVRSWLRTNAGGAPNTCKSRG